MQTNKGSIVNAVVDETPAFEGDILVGDMITSVDGQAITNTVNFNGLIRQKAGQKVTIGIIRQGKALEKTVQLGKL